MSMFARTSDSVPRGTPKKPRVLVETFEKKTDPDRFCKLAQIMYPYRVVTPTSRRDSPRLLLPSQEGPDPLWKQALRRTAQVVGLAFNGAQFYLLQYLPAKRADRKAERLQPRGPLFNL